MKFEISLDSKDGKLYKVCNDTYYNVETPNKVIQVLERCRKENVRVKLYLGNRVTGRDWCETNDVMGYIGRSGGSMKIPILVYSKRSLGGGAILDHTILKIVESRGKRVLYQAPHYKTPEVEIKSIPRNAFPYEVHVNGNVFSRHSLRSEAENLKRKII